MDSFEINKIIAAVILVVVLVVGIDNLSTFIFHVDKPENNDYDPQLQELSNRSFKLYIYSRDLINKLVFFSFVPLIIY